MANDTTEHYQRLAATYDENWTYSPEYVQQFSRAIVDTLHLTSSDVIADIGCGTGLYTRQVYEDVQPEHPILCIDPVRAMLDQLPTSPGLQTVLATAEDVASARVTLPTDRPLDAIVIKEAIHHVENTARTVAGLVNLLGQRGRLLVAMLPTSVRYPLFARALARFEQLQPDSEHIRGHIQAAGLRARVERASFTVSIERTRYISMVRSRYMSVLSTFTDAELEDGARQIESLHPESLLTFPDDFDFVVGER